MRVFSTAFSLQDPLPMIYREALRQVYREQGWDTVIERGDAGRDYPIMSDFYAAIKRIADGLEYGRPVHLKVPEFGDQPSFAAAMKIDNSDDGIGSYMVQQRSRLGLDEVPVVPWETSLGSTEPVRPPAPKPTNGSWRAAPEALNLLLSAPLQTCAYCLPLHATGLCKYGSTVRRRLLADESFRTEREAELKAALAEDDVARRWQLLNGLGTRVEERVKPLEPADRPG